MVNKRNFKNKMFKMKPLFKMKPMFKIKPMFKMKTFQTCSKTISNDEFDCDAILPRKLANLKNIRTGDSGHYFSVILAKCPELPVVAKLTVLL